MPVHRQRNREPAKWIAEQGFGGKVSSATQLIPVICLLQKVYLGSFDTESEAVASVGAALERVQKVVP